MKAIHLHQADLTGAPDSITARIKNSWWNDDHTLVGIRRGVVTFGSADTEKTITLSPAEADTSYDVIPGFAGGTSGAPFLQVRVKPASKATGQFILQLDIAPGGSETVDVAWLLTRD